ncbi:two-component system, sensor histidine kinase YesM [Paenibacillus sp. UNCCL117]|uniref:cache domain-containing sensor histidine kinase n=1 Tax=unclassified Paenibacillus TaxID=185978 RepID=UPI0008872E74|nr:MULTISPECIES: sensor histidine kinase [unclassified Paenibacillus]SDE25523.1 two-component system, sensor histidine kinase YesM [Paenibacillus sp. cl123]SFW62436.1 two-component system, sensor histidine kinase YesM [Paenibacillus sp. UNCCL117]
MAKETNGRTGLSSQLKPFIYMLAVNKKVWIAYVAIILLPALLFIKLYLDRSSNLLKQEVTHSILQAIRQVESNISYRLSKVKEASDSLIMNPDLHQMVGRPAEEDTLQVQIEDQRHLYKLIVGEENGSEVRKVRLFVAGRKIYASDHVNFYDLDTVKGEDWFASVAAKNGAVYWLDTVYYKYSNAEEGQHILSLARTVKEPRDYAKVAGLLVVDMPERIISSVLQTVQFPKMDLAVIDASGKVLSHLDASRIGTWIEPEVWELARQEAEGIAVDEKRQEFVIYKTIPSTGWKVVSRISEEQILASNDKYNRASTLVIAISLLVLFIFAVIAIVAVITEATIKRIRQIGAMIKKEGIDTLDDGMQHDQLTILGLEKSVGVLIHMIKNLANETYSAKAKERDAQLRALQAQINPHFLYNTLDTINWMAIRRDADEISSIVNSLAQYFRLSLNKGRDMVTIHDELNLAAAYLDIQRNRFADVFDYRFEMEESLYELPIPKLSLQPLIENALLHGLQQTPMERQGLLIVEGGLTDYGYRIAVVDNGVGMEEGKLAALLREDDGDERLSYGLYNVNQRIKLFAGASSGVFIRSKAGEGTVAEIRVTLENIQALQK